MLTKSYQLVAWTDRGQVKMIPSLLDEYARPYIERIDRERAFWEMGWCREKGVLRLEDVLSLSRSYEAYGRFLLAHGKRQEALRAFSEGAEVCLDDRFLLDSEFGYVLPGILTRRYAELASLIYTKNSYL